MFGIILVDKPLGITSHDVVNQVRRKLGTRRVGHAGTLDPLATGLLVVAVGPATRFLQYLPLEPKTYTGTIRFGQSTTTYDAEGEVDREEHLPSDLDERIRMALPTFVGAIEQLPPMHSAVKRGGKPLYAYAREGKTVERDSRVVYVDRFAVPRIDGCDADFEVVCSGGTYVRTLAHDLGKAVGCGAHLKSLCRTAAGKFSLDAACSPDDVHETKLIPLHEALPPMPLVQLEPAEVRFAQGGRQVVDRWRLDATLVGMLDGDGLVIGVARVENGALQPICVLPVEVVDGAV